MGQREIEATVRWEKSRGIEAAGGRADKEEEAMQVVPLSWRPEWRASECVSDAEAALAAAKAAGQCATGL